MLSERIRELVGKRDKGTCSPAELQELETWYASHNYLESQIEASLSDNIEDAEQLKSSIYSGIREQLDLTSVTPGWEKPGGSSVSFVRRWWKQSLAACAVLLILAGIVLYEKQNALQGNTILISTKEGEARKVLLPDSSVVWLKPGSRIRYDHELGKRATRELFLEGECLFDIAHDASSPFIVHTQDLDIKVLGTVFNVRSERKNHIVETTLFKGSVRIEKRDGSRRLVTLTPNQRAVYSKESHHINVSKLPTAGIEVGTGQDEKGFAGPSMVFDERPFTELLSQMEKKFDIKIYIQNRYLLTCPITADLEKESLSDILNLLKIGYGVDYTLYGKELFVEGKICNQ